MWDESAKEGGEAVELGSDVGLAVTKGRGVGERADVGGEVAVALE